MSIRMLASLPVLGLTLVVALVLSAPAAVAADSKYVGVKKCRTCHKKDLIGDQYGEWKDGKHAKAYDTLKSDKALEYAKKAGLDGAPHESADCLKCHVTGYGVDAALLPKKGIKNSNSVMCESCHGPGSGYRKKKVMSDHAKAVAAGLWEPGKDEKICLACHNDESPAWDPKKFKLAGGGTAGFDFEQAKAKIAHPIPEDVKGKYLEIEKKRKAEKRARGEEVDDE